MKSRSASTAAGGAFTQAIGGAVVTTDISVLSLMTVAVAGDGQYNYMQKAPAEGRARWDLCHAEP
jgi:hypothetical protein